MNVNTIYMQTFNMKGNNNKRTDTTLLQLIIDSKPCRPEEKTKKLNM